MRIYLEMVKYLLQTYESDDVITEANANLTRYMQQSAIMTERYNMGLEANSRRCKELHDERVRRGIVIKGLYESDYHSLRL